MLTDKELQAYEDLSFALDVEADWLGSRMVIEASFAIQKLLDYTKELKAELNKNVS